MCISIAISISIAAIAIAISIDRARKQTSKMAVSSKVWLRMNYAQRGIILIYNCVYR